MERAKQMLEEGKLSITEISLKTGYNNLTHFSRAFKKYHGNNPNHYRKE
jgi:YesN/AraC family two-component response regulator